MRKYYVTLTFLMSIFIITPSHSQTFDWENSHVDGVGVKQTVNGVQATVTVQEKVSRTSLGGYLGTSGNTIYTTYANSHITIKFSKPIDVSKIFFFVYIGYGTYDFTSVGNENNQTVSITSTSTNPSIGEYVVLNWARVTEIRIARRTGFMWAGIDNIHFSLPPDPITWNGTTNTDWNTASNWSTNTVPNYLHDVVIPSGLTTYPTLPANSEIKVNSVTMSSGACLVTKDATSFTGKVTYKRTIQGVTGNKKGWYLMASPVKGQTYDEAYVAANNIATSGTNRAIATYDIGQNRWRYMQAGTTNDFKQGAGYSMKRASSGDISFTGTLNLDDSGVDVPLTTENNRHYNLVGNPYTSYIDGTQLLNQLSLSKSQTVWVWDQTTGENGMFNVKTTMNVGMIAPGQGFFVCTNPGGGTLHFSESMQQHNTADTFSRKVSHPEIKLTLSKENIHHSSTVYYGDNATEGFDVGLEGELYNGSKNSFAIFTNLVSGTDNKDYQIQTLPKDGIETTVVPVGVYADAGTQIKISAEMTNLPEGIEVYLEDKLTNTFTLLNDSSSYTTTLAEDMNGVGRFYMRTSSQALSTGEVRTETVKVYKTSENMLRVIGLDSGDAQVHVYNVLGKKVTASRFTANGYNEISLPKVETGMYIVQVSTKNGKFTKKIMIE